MIENPTLSQSLFEPYSPIAAFATTPTAVHCLQPLSTGVTLWVPESLSHLEGVQAYSGSLKDHIASIWSSYRAFVFCLATGAVVRLIAPLLQDKTLDPAVVVVDETGKFVISLCSGHLGGANSLTELIAHFLGANPIITGSSTGLQLPAIDVLGLRYGWRKGEGNWTGVSAAVAKGDRVEVIQEAGSTLWQDHLPEGHPFVIGFPESLTSATPKARIWITPTKRRFSPSSDFPKVQWHPRVLWVGLGCERGTSKRVMEVAIEEVCQRYHLAREAIAGIATIDLKSDEIGILQLCEEYHYPLKTFSAAVLKRVDVPTPSEIVNLEVGTPSVAEAAALAAVGTRQNTPLLVPKQVVKLEGEAGAVTVAIAQAELEYTGRSGKLFLVGMGPGALTQMTPAARSAINQADAIIGYSLYIELIASLQRPGQIIEALPITQERQRAQRAIELAQWGLTVAVVSSGDCGIYGMAGLVLEELAAMGWNGETPQIEVFPGISALQAAAARVGAPLMHDFCAISLSDLLTPWEMIEKRLEAAAMADFVVALYNPRSRSRTSQMTQAHAILLKYRPPHTPVALVRSAYRTDEQITLTTLKEMLQFPIDMLTTVLIGNCSTKLYSSWMITPRGYLGFNYPENG